MSRAIPIRLRLAALFATGTALVIGVGGAVFVTELSGALTNSLATGIESRAVLIATASRTRPVLSTGSRASNSFAQVLSSRGVVLDSSGLEARHALVAPTKLATITTRGILLPEPLGDGDDGLLYLESLPRGHDVLVVGTSLQTVDEALDNIEASLLIGGPVAVVLAAIASYLLAAGALRPVERLRRQAAAISEHDETTSLDIPRTDDEVAALARTLNDLLYRLQGALGRQRGFVSAAGHELRTPLANLKLELELAQRPGRSREELLAAIAGSADEVERLATVTGRLLLLAQSDERAPLVLRNHLDVVPVLTAAVDSCATIARERDVDLHLALRDPRLVADVDEVALSQIVGNLLDNALRYAPPGSRVEVGAHKESTGPCGTTTVLVIDVADEGPGFPVEFLPRAFERFSRPDSGRNREGGGVGLGLAIVKALVEAHGGDVIAANRLGGGAIVHIRIPGGNDSILSSTIQDRIRVAN
ncbi:MAG TPA: ATP-binding protein [Acidimicrobiales bacterium]